MARRAKHAAITATLQRAMSAFPVRKETSLRRALFQRSFGGEDRGRGFGAEGGHGVIGHKQRHEAEPEQADGKGDGRKGAGLGGHGGTR